MHRIRWDDLQFLLAVADHGSLSAAARALGVNHSTVLRRLSAFEERHGINIFERDARGYRPSIESNHLFKAMQSVEQTINSLERALAGKSMSLDGPLRLTSTESLFKAVLLPHINNFHERHPGVQIELIVTNARLNFAQLDADITLRPTKELPKDLSGSRVCDLAFRVFGAPSYLARHTSADPAQHRWLGSSRSLAQSPVGLWEERTLPSKAIVMRSDSFVTLSDAAALGLGLAMVPCCLGDTRDDLIRANAFPDVLTTGLWIATHPDLMDVPRIQVCMSYFAEALRADRTILSGA